MDTAHLQAEAVRQLLAVMPRQAGSFAGSQFPLPVKTTIVGKQPLDLAALTRRLTELAGGDVKYLLEPLLVAAEAVESVMPDRQDRFLSDDDVRGRVFMGAKWLAGWALVLGERNRAEILRQLQDR